MQKSIITIMCLVSISFLASCKKEQKVIAPSALIIQSFIGDVKVERAGISSDVLAGQSLSSRDTLVTGKKSTIDILCSTEGVIRINELSRLSIESLASNENAVNASLNLEKGKVFASIAKMKKDSSLSIKTSTAIAAVRGTSFRVSSSDAGASVEVLSGKVQMNPVVDDKVVETVSTVIETNRTASISVKEAKVMAASDKKEIAVVAMQPAAVEEIKKESSGISIAKTASPDLKQELDNVGIKSIEVDVKPIPPEAVKETAPEQVADLAAEKKAKEDKSLADKQENERLAKEKADKALADKQEKERFAKTKAEKEKLEKELLAKQKADEEQRQREEAARLKAENERIAKEKAAKEQDQKESRVKNIPNM